MMLSGITGRILGWLRWRFGPEFDDNSRDGYLYDQDPNQASIIIRLGNNYPVDKERIIRPAIYVIPKGITESKVGIPMNGTYRIEDVATNAGKTVKVSHHLSMWGGQVLLRCEALAPIEALRIAERCALSIVELNHLFSQWIGAREVGNIQLLSPENEKQEDDVWPTDVQFDIVWENKWSLIHPGLTPDDMARKISVLASI